MSTDKKDKTDLGKIPLNYIVQDLRVKEYLRKKEREIRKESQNYYKDYHSQINDCHAWLLTLHYAAIARLQDKYYLTKPEFMVLLGAYLLKSTGNNGFRIKKLSTTLLSWQYNRVYHHLFKLYNKGYIRIHRNKYSRSHHYWIKPEGVTVIRAFSQHYWQIYQEVMRDLGDLSRTPASPLLSDTMYSKASNFKSP